MDSTKPDAIDYPHAAVGRFALLGSSVAGIAIVMQANG
jgi:hypothetical protein